VGLLVRLGEGACQVQVGVSPYHLARPCDAHGNALQSMLRVNSSNVLVVPPWECAWLSDEQLQLQDGAGCICFDVKGTSPFLALHLAHTDRHRLLIAIEMHPQAKMTQQSYSNLLLGPRGGNTTSEIIRQLRT